MGIPIPGKDGLYIETGPRGLVLAANTECEMFYGQEWLPKIIMLIVHDEHLTDFCLNYASVLPVLVQYSRADSRFVPSQWQTALQSNALFHWLGASLESALYFMQYCVVQEYVKIRPDSFFANYNLKAGCLQ